jgi:hypothetical protein
MDNSYGRNALKKMLTEIWNNSGNTLINGTDDEYSNTVHVIDTHLSEKMRDGCDDLEDFLLPCHEDTLGEQTKDEFMYNLVSYTLSCDYIHFIFYSFSLGLCVNDSSQEAAMGWQEIG